MILIPRSIASLGRKGGFYAHEEAYNSRTVKQIRRALERRARHQLRQEAAAVRTSPIPTSTNGTGT